jgi:nicotinamidase/pyrazinamidase
MPNDQRNKSALLIVDVQKDFCAGGALAVPESERVLLALNRHLARAAGEGMPVYASRDWHPEVTNHFAPYGGQWPVHCVRETVGAQFHSSLQLPTTTIVVSKGVGPNQSGYSAFEGRTGEGRAFLVDLMMRGVTRLEVGGLAIDYCVRASVLDALSHGIEVTILSDAIAGVDLAPGDSARAIAEMRSAGAEYS